MLKKYEKVCYELLRPQQIKNIKDECPIVYITAGSLEWHGFQNPLGTDGHIGHAMCCESALKYGGIVLPPYYLGLHGEYKSWGPGGWDGYTLGFNDDEIFFMAMRGLCKGLVHSGWKVLAGVTGHAVPEQREQIRRAIESETGGTDVNGFAIYEGELHAADVDIPLEMDHAGAWETSCMMYLYPDVVDLSALNDSSQKDSDFMECDWSRLETERDGVNGMNPLKFASCDMGRKIIETLGNRIGRKASEMLAQLK